MTDNIRDDLNAKLDDGRLVAKLDENGMPYLERTDKGAMAGDPPTETQVKKNKKGK
jgi:hypothetical protein